jgi:major type 1 subunit fimbrin (pilin)
MNDTSTYQRYTSFGRLVRLLCVVFKIVVIHAVGTSTASAACIFVHGETTRNYTFTVPALNIPRDAAPGTVLYTSMQNAQPPSISFADCTTGGGTANRTVTGGSQVSINPFTYATNIPGIGIRYFDFHAVTKRYWGAGNQETSNSQWFWSGASLGIEIVLTGPVDSGTTNGAIVGTFRLPPLIIANLRVNGFQVIPTTCSTTALPVNMPEVAPSTLPAIGSTSGTTPFSIQLSNCPVSIQQIAYQLEAPDGVVNAVNGIFLASKSSTSKGVALAITDTSNQPVSLSKRNPIGDFRPGPGAAYDIKLVAKYYRTGAVSPGTVSGQLIYTMFYQ